MSTEIARPVLYQSLHLPLYKLPPVLTVCLLAFRVISFVDDCNRVVDHFEQALRVLAQIEALSLLGLVPLKLTVFLLYHTLVMIGHVLKIDHLVEEVESHLDFVCLREAVVEILEILERPQLHDLEVEDLRLGCCGSVGESIFIVEFALFLVD